MLKGFSFAILTEDINLSELSYKFNFLFFFVLSKSSEPDKTIILSTSKNVF